MLSTIGIVHAGVGFNLMSDNVPEPTLISPSDEIVDLRGKDYLEFRWSPHETAPLFKRFNDFRLYEGYDMIQSTLIYKKEICPRDSAVKIDSGVFKNGRIYSWSLRFVFDEGRKSRKVSASFSVIR